MSVLVDSIYGKDNVKFLKIKRDPSNPKIQDVIEVTVKVLLKGAFDVSYTKADNSPIVPTDTVKNTILIKARTEDPFLVENFANILASHFLAKYDHISSVDVDIIQLRWSKYLVNDKFHDHSFIKDGDEKRICHLFRSRVGDFKLTSGIKDLTLLKSTGSMFYGYNKCDYTTLKPTNDRILSTDVDASWVWSNQITSSNISDLSNNGLFDKTYASARKITLDLFATQNSPSVQATMYDMASEILKTSSKIKSVTYTLPNKHYFLMDFSWFNNLKNDEVFYPSPHPNGLINCTVTRDPKSKL
ncbi:urate oxidase [Ascoidea rubescens DSM 1968]|uniref:Uricase n=1 Tax=Ascoidea rubescens DSM 1968 TaxID=1344418 RepID=A0A1D2VNB0_9ASCO|nr:uricase [Ascoidea rubescens DSM 1968]ODV63079.1 uricase [Ascoidea rubescens DSM 1968]